MLCCLLSIVRYLLFVCCPSAAACCFRFLLFVVCGCLICGCFVLKFVGLVVLFLGLLVVGGLWLFVFSLV